MSSFNITISSDIPNEIDTINSLIILLARYVLPIIIVISILGNTMNIYVFTRPTLRKNPCCLYFLSSSIIALIYEIIDLPIRSLQFGYAIDIAQCLLFGSITTLYASSQWYITLTPKQTRDSLQAAKETLFYTTTGYIGAAGFASTFFLFTLTSPLFRKHLFHRHN
ncbi:unnamed protein product [Adineta ricciae]|uniref:Uncharacterized protein n=1 Tax=Adineta ricciae TaxID=249248 RepID=A0A815BQZ4_ADIRI|nr:unnamed protein product [Adineta ricciae]CAF1402238.1 unnamed protein product [Adineta ricciae]